MNMSRTDVNKWLDENKYHEENMNSLNSSNTVINTPSVTQVIDNTPKVENISTTSDMKGIFVAVMNRLDDLQKNQKDLEKKITDINANKVAKLKSNSSSKVERLNATTQASTDVVDMIEMLHTDKLDVNANNEKSRAVNYTIPGFHAWSCKGLRDSAVSYCKRNGIELPSVFNNPKNLERLSKIVRLQNTLDLLRDRGYALRELWVDSMSAPVWVISKIDNSNSL